MRHNASQSEMGLGDSRRFKVRGRAKRIAVKPRIIRFDELPDSARYEYTQRDAEMMYRFRNA